MQVYYRRFLQAKDAINLIPMSMAEDDIWCASIAVNSHWILVVSTFALTVGLVFFQVNYQSAIKA